MPCTALHIWYTWIHSGPPVPLGSYPVIVHLKTPADSISISVAERYFWMCWCCLPLSGSGLKTTDSCWCVNTQVPCPWYEAVRNVSFTPSAKLPASISFHTSTVVQGWMIHSFFPFLKDCIYSCLWEEGREKERERNVDARKKHGSVASGRCPDQGPNLWPFGFRANCQWNHTCVGWIINSLLTAFCFRAWISHCGAPVFALGSASGKSQTKTNTNICSVTYIVSLHLFHREENWNSRVKELGEVGFKPAEWVWFQSPHCIATLHCCYTS